MKVLLVAGGSMPIPPPAWGGVENLIWQQKSALEAAGHEVHILNKSRKRHVTALRARPWTYDVVHLHLDSFAEVWVPLSRWLRFPLVVSTHFGYAAFPEKWTDSFRETALAMCRARHMIVLSEEMKRVFVDMGSRAKIWALPNGIYCRDVHLAPAPTRQVIVLGRIEPRKQQAWMTRTLNNHTVECDFVGPVEDDTGFAPNGQNTRFLGEWSRDKIKAELTEYACLALMSDGEGHAAVVSEAMAAGLSIVVSPEASHNLDVSQPSIYVVDRTRDDLGDVLAAAVRDNPAHRPAIRRYCEAHFDWTVIFPRYIAILAQIAAGTA